MFKLKINTNSKIAISMIIPLLIVGVLLSVFNNVNAASVLSGRSIKISDPNPSVNNVNYQFDYQLVNPYVLGSLTLEFCSNSPLLALPCTPINGFDASGAIIINQYGINGWSIAPGSTSSKLIFTRIAANEGPINAYIELGGITNPSAVGTIYAKVQTFSSTDASGLAVEEGGTVFIINNPVGISTEVPPYLFLCVAASIAAYDCNNTTGNFIDFGEFSKTVTKTATSQFIVATNAGQGFVVYASGNPPTSGNNVIPAMTTQAGVSKGQGQFGMNLRDNSNPDVGQDPVGIGTGNITASYNTPNQFKFNSGDSVVSSNTTTNDRKFTVSYIVNVNGAQKPGIYNTTILYTALATF